MHRFLRIRIFPFISWLKQMFIIIFPVYLHFFCFFCCCFVLLNCEENECRRTSYKSRNHQPNTNIKYKYYCMLKIITYLAYSQLITERESEREKSTVHQYDGRATSTNQEYMQSHHSKLLYLLFMIISYFFPLSSTSLR